MSWKACLAASVVSIPSHCEAARMARTVRREAGIARGDIDHAGVVCQPLTRFLQRRSCALDFASMRSFNALRTCAFDALSE
jgi:hypothetical protein